MQRCSNGPGFGNVHGKLKDLFEDDCEVISFKQWVSIVIYFWTLCTLATLHACYIGQKKVDAGYLFNMYSEKLMYLNLQLLLGNIFCQMHLRRK